MKLNTEFSIFTLISMAMINCSSSPTRSTRNIQGDFESNRPHEAPHQAVAMPPLPHVRLAIMDGSKDTQDRHQSAVKVDFNEKGNEFCSGVLINPYLVLTAAHCFCRPDLSLTEQVVRISDKCIKKATAVKAFFYQPTQIKDEAVPSAKEKSATLYTQPSNLSDRYETSAGQMKVEVHPHFKLAYNSNGDVTEKRADLAVIHLEKPILRATLAFNVPPTQEVAVGDELFFAGYGKTHPTKGAGVFGVRYFGSNVVKAVYSWADPADAEGRVKVGMILFQGDGPNGKKAHALDGDSGGPVFAEREDGIWLVGITHGFDGPSTTSQRASMFTSTFVYREWISQQKNKSEEQIKKLKTELH